MPPVSSTLRGVRAALLAGTALTGRVLGALVPAVAPTLAVSTAVAVASPVVFGIGGGVAWAGNGGEGGTFAVGGGGAAGMPGVDNGNGVGAGGTGGSFVGFGGGGGAPGSAGGRGGQGINGTPGFGGTAGAGNANTPGGNATGITGGGSGGGGGAGGANPAAVPTFANMGVLRGNNNGGAGGNGNNGGGGGGGAGGYGIIANGAGGASTNSGGVYIFSGYGGRGGNGCLANNPCTTGAGGNGGDGGIGVQFTTSAVGATFSNAKGSGVRGGGGGYGGAGGFGGAGGVGGIGVQFNATGALANAGYVRGGQGGRAGTGNNGVGGAGGIGVQFNAMGTLTNTGTVQGGPGGYHVNGVGGGVGGVGVSMLAGGTIANNGGKIIGGAGGEGAPAGIAIVGANLTIGNAGGTILGGPPSPDAAGVASTFAIQFTGGTNTVDTGGTITGGINILAGSFQPALNGTTPGTPLAVGGPIAFAAGSFYNIRITPTATDSTVATGTATLTGAKVNVLAGQGTYAARQYTILTAAGGLGGTTFAGVTSNLAFLMPTLSYDPTDTMVYLNITGNAGGTINYTTAAATTNQIAVAYGLNAGEKATGGNNPILTAFNQLTVAQAQAAFNAVSGEGFAAAQNTAFGSTGLFISSIFDQTTFYGGAGSSPNQITLTETVPGFTALAPADGSASFTRTPIHELADLPSRVAPTPASVFVPQRTWRAWATGFGGVEDFSGNAFPVGSAGQSDTIYGGTLGIDYQLMPNYLAGLAIGGSNGDFSVPGRATSGSTTGGHVAFYDLATFGAFYAASTTSASFYSNQTTRTIAGFGGLGGETDRGNFRSNAYSSKVEFGRHFSAYGGVITPFASIELTELRSYGFTETPLSGPGLFALNVQGQDTASVPSLVGARFQTVLPLGNGLVLSPSLQLAWEHQFSPQRPVLAGLINLPGAVFLTNGASPARDSAAVKAGGELAITRQAALFANFDGDFSGVDRFYGGKGGFKYVW